MKFNKTIFFAILILILQTTDAQIVVVAVDGTGNYATLSAAIDAAPEYSIRTHVIHVTKGVYMENVEVGLSKWNITLIGDGIDVTVISGSRSYDDGWTTSDSATFAVYGPGFIAQDLTFQNTAGPEKHQAVAFHSKSENSVLYRCAFRGYQDTLYAHEGIQFYRDCLITGTVDFIFGNGKAIFQNCLILGRKCLPEQKNTITAQGRLNPADKSGFVIQFSNISVLDSTPTYLGRPWKLFSRTIIMQTYISEDIRPEGWLKWEDSDVGLDTLYYGEYKNFGPGAGVERRVSWPGYHRFNDPSQVLQFTVGEFLSGDTWLPATGVPYTKGL